MKFQRAGGRGRVVFGSSKSRGAAHERDPSLATIRNVPEIPIVQGPKVQDLVHPTPRSSQQECV